MPGETRSLEIEYKTIRYIYLSLCVLQAGNSDNLAIITMQCYQKFLFLSNNYIPLDILKNI